MVPSPAKQAELETRMTQLGISMDDIEIKFIKSSGRGGQKVNKTSSAVFLRHRPTALTVKCGRERSQALNRFLALRQLVEKIERAQSGGITESQHRILALKKQKMRRRKKARAKHHIGTAEQA